MKPIVVMLVVLLCQWRWQCSASISCLHSKVGHHYTGQVNVTMSGTKCTSWLEAKDKYSLSKLKLNSYRENYCRNPNNGESLWCFTKHNETEKCEIPMCPANSKAAYCILVPKIHFTICPAIFAKITFFQDYGLNQIIFCCTLYRADFMDLLPSDACLIVVVQVNDVKEYFSPCPPGFHSQSIVDNLLESNVIYKCCKIVEPSKTVSQVINNGEIQNNSKIAPILAYVISNNSLCRELFEYSVSAVEYHELDKLTNQALPSKVTICFYYSQNFSGVRLNHSQLGFMSLKDCPTNFVQSYPSSNFVSYKSRTLKLCYPNSTMHSYVNESMCFHKPVITGLYLCPKKLQSFAIYSSLYQDTFTDLCCRYQIDQSSTIHSTLDLNDNASISFIVPTERCPTIKFNIPTIGFLIKAAIKRNTGIQHEYNPIVTVCNFEPQKDEFAYKKIGQECPAAMFKSSCVVKLRDRRTNELSTESFLSEYCVGSAASTGKSFPSGNYCVYKIGRQCPSGFSGQFVSQRRVILSADNIIPDYDHEALCCRKDGFDREPSFADIPFVLSNTNISFGLLLLNNYNACPNISTFKSYQDFDIDGPYCAYRSTEEYHKWKNEIIWPQQLPENNHSNIAFKYKYISNINVDKFWTRINSNQYQSSTIYKYPRGSFCLLTQNTCMSIDGVTFIIKYPVKEFTICCVLRSDWLVNGPMNNPSFNPKNKQSIGYVSFQGRCPALDPKIFQIVNLTNDTFEIEENNFDREYRINLLKIGIIPDLTYRKKFVKVDFQFCIFQNNEEMEFIEKSNIIFPFGFIKPWYSLCPVGFNPLRKEILTDSDEDLDTMSRHFIATNAISLCLPFIKHKKHEVLSNLESLCQLSVEECSTDLVIEINVPRSEAPLRICCSKLNVPQNMSNIGMVEFALPLHPEKRDCPYIRNYSSLMWKIFLRVTSRRRYITMCYFYLPKVPRPWPSGNYLTVAYRKQCPNSFVFKEYNGTDYCIRNNTRPSYSQFPEGNFCVLTFVNMTCPSTAVWQWTIHLIALGSNVLNLCCLTTNVILDIPLSKSAVFAFLSVEKCSHVPRTQVRQTYIFNTIVRCIYTRNDCGHFNNTKCLHSDSLTDLNNSNDVPISPGINLSVALVVTIPVVFMILGLLVLAFNRDKLVRFRSSRIGNMKLVPIYATVDTIANDDYNGNVDEDIPSVVYSTID